MKPIIIVSTFPNKTVTKKVANQLVKKKLAACVNITKIDSVYSWKGKIQNDSEYLVFFKTTKKNEKNLKNEIKKLHPYDVPCLLYTSPSPRDRTRSRMPSSA